MTLKPKSTTTIKLKRKGEMNMRDRKRNAAEIIATHLNCDYAEVRDSRYQPGSTRVPIFTIQDDYYCSPSKGQKPPKTDFDGVREWNWEWVGEQFGRDIYIQKCF